MPWGGYQLSPCGSFPWHPAHRRGEFVLSLLATAAQVWGGERGVPPGDGHLRAALAKTPYPWVITGVVFHSLPSPVSLLRVCSINWSRLDSGTGVCLWVLAMGGRSGSAPLLRWEPCALLLRSVKAAFQGASKRWGRHR